MAKWLLWLFFLCISSQRKVYHSLTHTTNNNMLTAILRNQMFRPSRKVNHDTLFEPSVYVYLHYWESLSPVRNEKSWTWTRHNWANESAGTFAFCDIGIAWSCGDKDTYNTESKKRRRKAKNHGKKMHRLFVSLKKPDCIIFRPEARLRKCLERNRLKKVCQKTSLFETSGAKNQNRHCLRLINKFQRLLTCLSSTVSLGEGEKSNLPNGISAFSLFSPSAKIWASLQEK